MKKHEILDNIRSMDSSHAPLKQGAKEDRFTDQILLYFFGKHLWLADFSGFLQKKNQSWL